MMAPLSWLRERV